MKSTRELRKAPDLRFAASRESRADSTRSQVNTNYQHINIWGIPGNTLRRTQIVVHRPSGCAETEHSQPLNPIKTGTSDEVESFDKSDFPRNPGRHDNSDQDDDTDIFENLDSFCRFLLAFL